MDTPPVLSMYHFQATMPMAQMDDFAPVSQQEQLLQAQQQLETTDRARAYKSRNKRPCDFCRYKKAACHLDDHPPCELCIRYNKECTFVESPAKRRRPNESMGNGRSNSNDYNSYTNHERNGSIASSLGPFGNEYLDGGIELQQDMASWENGMPSYPIPMVMDNGLGAHDFPLDPAFYQQAGFGFNNFAPIIESTTVNPMEYKMPPPEHRNSVDTTISPVSSSAQLPANLALPFETSCGEPSLDLQSSSNSQIVGMSGESDPYLLSRYRYDRYNEAVFQSIRIRKMADGPGLANSIPTFFTIQHNALAAKAQPLEKTETQEQYRREVEDMVSDDVGRRLIRLFYRYIQPYCPVLCYESTESPWDTEGSKEPGSISTCLLAAIYGHALAFCPWDEKLCVEVYTPPSADALFTIAWQACMSEFHAPSLAVLQSLLLLVQRRPTNKHVSDTPFKGVMMAAVISIAQSLGLNRDPSGWPLPTWEVKLRRRLAWAIFIQDKWLALNSGKSSLMCADDWDVNPLSEADFITDDPSDHISPAGAGIHQHFMSLCELTRLVDDILRSLFSIKATKALHNSVEATLEVAKPLRLRLTEWYQNLPSGLLPHSDSESPNDNRRASILHELDGNGSLQLAYITAKIELFRAMLRPRITDSNATALTALRTGAMAVAKEVFEFLDALHARELEAFWASYSRTNFTIASSFMLLLYVTSPNLADAKECLNLLNAWRSLLRIKSRSCDLLNLALLRLDGVWVAGIDRLIELSPAAAQAWSESGQGMS